METTALRWKTFRPDALQSKVRPHQSWPGPTDPSAHLWNYKSIASSNHAYKPYLSAPALLPPLDIAIRAPFWLRPRDLEANPRFVSCARLQFQGPRGFLLNRKTDAFPDVRNGLSTSQKMVVYDWKTSPSIYQEDFVLRLK